jgi:hypothetical protein
VHLARTLCDSLVAEVLILSALYKLANPDRYRQAAAGYSLYRRAAGRLPIPAWLPWLLPLLEIAAGGLLLTPNVGTQLAGGALASMLFVLFLVLLDRDDRVYITNCGCWGRDDVTVPRVAFLWRNGIVAGVAFAALALAANTGPLSSGFTTLAGVGLALPFAMLALEFPTVASLFALRPPSAMAESESRSRSLS